MENGCNSAMLVGQLFANRISAFFGLDVLVSSAVLLVFMRVEGRLLRMRRRWIPMAALCAVELAWRCRCFSIFANARWKDYQEQLKQYRRSGLD